METERQIEPHIQEAIDRFRRLEEARDSEMTVQLDEILLRMRERFRPATNEQVAEWEWENCVRDMTGLGWDKRHCYRIAPNWNCPDQEQAFQHMSGLLNGKGAVVALVGERGVGKTTIAAEHSRLRLQAQKAYFSIPANERIRPHPPFAPGRYEKLGRMANMFKPLYADFGSINSDMLSGQLDRWCKADLVVLDELHETEDLRTNMRFLVDFVDRRYANHKDTILISNHSGEEFATHVNSSIISRINHHGDIIECDWESHRK